MYVCINTFLEHSSALSRMINKGTTNLFFYLLIFCTFSLLCFVSLRKFKCLVKSFNQNQLEVFFLIFTKRKSRFFQFRSVCSSLSISRWVLTIVVSNMVANSPFVVSVFVSLLESVDRTRGALAAMSSVASHSSVVVRGRHRCQICIQIAT